MPAPRPTVANARRLRKEMSPPEVMLWFAVRRGQLEGFKFRRQHPVGPYVLDFFCPAARLDVEIDSYAHCIDDRPARDANRDRWLLSQGIRTLRVPAHEVMKSVDGVLGTIREHLRHLPPPDASHPPPP